MNAVDWIKLRDAIEDEYAKSIDITHAHSHLRYEIVRKLTPKEFCDIYGRNLNGERFDDIIDGLITLTK